jgi:AraC-like DNA-binding protein
VFNAGPAIDDPLVASLGILATQEGGAVARAAAAAQLSERQYRRLFIRLYGVSPKRYQRAIRVDRMIRQLHDFPWEIDAYNAPIPFSDQPHAIREFRAMTGITPRAYLRAKESRDTTLRSVPVDGVAPPDELKELHDFG